MLPNAIAHEIGPTLPKYIVMIIIIFPNTFKDVVKFLDKPTVAAALIVSNIISIPGAFVTADKRIIDVKTTLKNVMTTAIAFTIDCFDIVLLKIVAF